MHRRFNKITNALKAFALMVVLLNIYARTANAQSLGDPIINITFGEGINQYAPPLDPNLAKTDYTYVNKSPNDGEYTIVNNSANEVTPDVAINKGWFTTKDHTAADGKGYFMLVNASYQPGVFYQGSINGLCGNTTYEFAAWVKNMIIKEGAITPDILFTVETLAGEKLGTGSRTGSIPGADNRWQQFSFTFTTPDNTQPLVLKMTNIAPGGVGNDVGIDDITFRARGPNIDVVFNQGDTASVTCEGTTRTLTMNVTSSTYPGDLRIPQIFINGKWERLEPPATKTAYLFQTPITPGVYRYRVVSGLAANIDNPKCLLASNELVARVIALPKPKIKVNPVGCVGVEVAFNDTAAAAGHTFLWNFGDGKTDTARAPKHIYVNSGSYTITLLTTNRFGCVAAKRDTVSVHISKLPQAGFNYSSPDCETNNVTFTDTSIPVESTIVKWTWDFGDNIIVRRTDGQPVQHVFAAAKTYNVTLLVETSNGCVHSISRSVIIHPLPQVSFTMPPSCVSDNITFVNTSTIANGTENQFAYLWDFGDGTAKQTTKNGTHKYTNFGDFDVTLVVTSGQGCKDTLTQKFRVNGPSPVADFEVLGGNTICVNREVLLRNKSSVPVFGDITKVEIFYDFANKQTPDVVDNSPYPDKVYTYQYPQFHSGTARTYEIRMLAYSGTLCVSAFKIQSVTILLAPKLEFILPAEICQNTGILTLSAIDIGGSGVAGTAVFSGKGVADDRFDPVAAGVDTIRISCVYTYNDGTGCADTLTRNIVVKASPTIEPGVDVRILEGETTVLKAIAKGNGLKYEWTPAAGLSDPAIATPVVLGGSTDMIYKVKVTNDQNCVDSAEFKVFTLKYLKIPNTFTPNGDGINDTWEIKYLSDYVGCTVDVFNRYGQKVFASVNYTIPWDGRMRTGDLAPGVYYYIINPKHGRKPVSGYITVIR